MWPSPPPIYLSHVPDLGCSTLGCVILFCSPGKGVRGDWKEDVWVSSLPPLKRLLEVLNKKGSTCVGGEGVGHKSPPTQTESFPVAQKKKITRPSVKNLKSGTLGRWRKSVDCRT